MLSTNFPHVAASLARYQAAQEAKRKAAAVYPHETADQYRHRKMMEAMFGTPDFDADFDAKAQAADAFNKEGR